MKKILIILLCYFSASTIFAQQIPQFNTFMFNTLLVNPAYAGSRDALSLSLVARQQWVGFDGAPSTQAFSLHSPLKNNHIRLGLEAENDMLGPEQNLSVKGTFAYAIRLANGHLSFGLRGGIIQHNFNWNKITYKNPNDVIPKNGVQSVTKPTFDFGMYYYNKTFYVGLDFEQLNHASYNIFNDTAATSSLTARDYTHSHFIIGKAFVFSDKVVFKPSLLIRTAENSPPSSDLNLSFLIDKVFWAGLGYKSKYGPYLLLEYYINNHFRVGYSYDMPYNLLLGTNGGSHELFLGYDFNIFNKNIVSPRFF